ncbi:hypothetical protein HPB49_015719 [Dermacentor silvarum]|uniref:Uncharacterized protein n=1 Tax=Dermacentor silvarum TaxID=543639 RepID=A0ACB8CYP7_DERSI|nr:hypothetical protein HPB49_015719 [Dermacentor silvarum]
MWDCGVGMSIPLRRRSPVQLGYADAVCRPSPSELPYQPNTYSHTNAVYRTCLPFRRHNTVNGLLSQPGPNGNLSDGPSSIGRIYGTLKIGDHCAILVENQGSSFVSALIAQLATRAAHMPLRVTWLIKTVSPSTTAALVGNSIMTSWNESLYHTKCKGLVIGPEKCCIACKYLRRLLLNQNCRARQLNSKENYARKLKARTQATVHRLRAKTKSLDEAFTQ